MGVFKGGVGFLVHGGVDGGCWGRGLGGIGAGWSAASIGGGPVVPRGAWRWVFSFERKWFEPLFRRRRGFLVVVVSGGGSWLWRGVGAVVRWVPGLTTAT